MEVINMGKTLQIQSFYHTWQFVNTSHFTLVCDVNTIANQIKIVNGVVDGENIRIANL